MAALHILVADDQIPPEDEPEEEFRRHFLAQFGDTPHNRGFLEQCIFMRQVVQALRDYGYRVTAARTFSEAAKQIADSTFDLAIVDLGWYMDASLPQSERPAAGWSLCERLDEKAESSGTTIPQIVFSSRFPTEPELSREAAKRRKLPLFKEATPVVRNSLMAAVGFVDATLAVQRASEAAAPDRFQRRLEDMALKYFDEALSDYRRWALLTVVFVAISLALLLFGVALAFTGTVAVATLSSITSLVTGLVSTLLYKRLSSAQKGTEAARAEVLAKLQTRAGGPPAPP